MLKEQHEHLPFKGNLTPQHCDFEGPLAYVESSPHHSIKVNISPPREREEEKQCDLCCAAQFRRRGKAEERIDFDGATATHENGHLELD